MTFGLLADKNLAKTATFSGGAWVAAQPVTNLNVEGYLENPARCATPATLSSSKFTATLLTARPVSVVGLLFHTLSSNALYRITVAGIDGDLSHPAYQSAWTPVVGRLSDSLVLDWEESNWWTGQPDEEEAALYPRHLLIAVQPAIIAGAIQIEIDDHTNEAGFFDIGGVWIARVWSPKQNFDRGRELGADSRAVVDEAPSGRQFAERRQQRRRLAVTWSGLTSSEALRLFDAGARADTTEEVLFVPDLDDALGLIREAWPATFEKPPAPKFTFEGLTTAAATFKEVIA